MLDFRHSRARRLYVGLVAAFTAVVVAATAYTLLRLRSEDIVHGHRIAALQARAIEDYLTQSFHNIDLTLQNALEANDAGNPERVARSFSAAIRHAPYLRSISLLDGSRRIVASTNPRNVGIQVAVGDFLPPAAPPAELLRVGPPWLGRDFDDGRPTTPEQPADGNALTFLPVQRTVVVDGRPTLLLATVNPDYFLGYLAQQERTRGGAVRVLRQDGTLLMSTREDDRPGVRDADVAKGGAPSESGVALDATHDGPDSFGAYRASRRFPLAVVSHYSHDAVLDEWRREVRLMLGVVGLSLGTSLALAMLLYRRLRRAADEQAEADRHLRLAARVFEASAEGILVANANRTIASVNPAFTDITGYSAADVVGRSPRMLSSGQHDHAFYERMWNAIESVGQWQGEIVNRRKNGVTYPEWLTITRVLDADGTVTHYVGVFSDITERKASESRVRYLSEHDFLTGLPNRFLFQDRVSQAIVHCVRHGGRLAVLFLDLDRFKAVNDSFGHEIGDRLLKEVAERLRGCVRAVDTVCRQGGDEFVILVEAIDHAEDAAHVAEKLIERIAEPYEFDGHKASVSASIGIALYPEDGRDMQTLIRAADTAMYQSKEHGRNTYRYVTRSLNAGYSERLAIEQAMRRALSLGELELHYQPIVAMANDGIVGAEALLRWTHPQLGPMSPLRFIPVAEESTLIVSLGEWVLREACRQIQRWDKDGLPLLTVSVNVSRQQFTAPDFVDTVRRILDEAGVPGSRIEFDVDEQVLLEPPEQQRAAVAGLGALGIRLAVDDFGVRHASLSSLHRLPVDKLKIDRSLVRDVLLDDADAMQATTIVRMAHSIGVRVLAEGIETQEVWDFFRALGCDEAQGFHHSHPLPARDLVALLRRQRGRLRRIA